jgi:hypothetical protein
MDFCLITHLYILHNVFTFDMFYILLIVFIVDLWNVKKIQIQFKLKFLTLFPMFELCPTFVEFY